MTDKFLSETERLYFESMELVELAKFFLDQPFDSMWFFVHHRYWAREQDFEMRMRRRSKRSLVYSPFNNFEIHSIPSWRRFT